MSRVEIVLTTPEATGRLTRAYFHDDHRVQLAHARRGVLLVQDQSTRSTERTVSALLSTPRRIRLAGKAMTASTLAWPTPLFTEFRPRVGDGVDEESLYARPGNDGALLLGWDHRIGRVSGGGANPTMTGSPQLWKSVAADLVALGQGVAFTALRQGTFETNPVVGPDLSLGQALFAPRMG